MIHRRWLRRFVELALLAIFLAFSASAWAAPPSEGLVLWLDADDEHSLSKDDDGRVSRWADRSGLENDASQSQPENRPRWETYALGGRPVVHFDGKRFLNLGQPTSLDFTPGKPFTIAVVSNVAEKDAV